MPIGKRLKASQVGAMLQAAEKEAMLPMIRIRPRDPSRMSRAERKEKCLELDLIALACGRVTYGAGSSYAPVRRVSLRIYNDLTKSSNWKVEGMPSGFHGLVEVASLIGKRVAQVSQHLHAMPSASV